MHATHPWGLAADSVNKIQRLSKSFHKIGVVKGGRVLMDATQTHAHTSSTRSPRGRSLTTRKHTDSCIMQYIHSSFNY